MLFQIALLSFYRCWPFFFRRYEMLHRPLSGIDSRWLVRDLGCLFWCCFCNFLDLSILRRRAGNIVTYQKRLPRELYLSWSHLYRFWPGRYCWPDVCFQSHNRMNRCRGKYVRRQFRRIRIVKYHNDGFWCTLRITRCNGDHA